MPTLKAPDMVRIGVIPGAFGPTNTVLALGTVPGSFQLCTGPYEEATEMTGAWSMLIGTS